jgi:tetratricopeptide (TPR) repeat protein
MNFKQIPWPRYIPFFVVALLLASYVTQINYDVWRIYSPTKIPTSYNVYIEPQPLAPSTAKLASFGATEFLADIYWLKLIQYYGGGDPQGKYRKLAELFNTVTELSPKFSDAYRTGLIVLPGEGFIDEALALGDKGMKNLPEDWQMPYYTGLVHHIYKKDYAKAAELFQKAASLPNAPENTKYFAALYFKEAGSRETAYRLFLTIYENSPDGFVKDRAGKYVGHMEGLFILEDAIKKFQETHRRLPSSLDELTEKKIVNELPQSPLDLPYLYDHTTGQVSDVKQ